MGPLRGVPRTLSYLGQYFGIEWGYLGLSMAERQDR